MSNLTSTDLIKVQIEWIGGTQVQRVEARDMYLGLGLARAEWSRWAARNIEGDTFFVENKDWAGFVLNTNGNDTQDYVITLEFAKHLAMMARTEKAYDYRNYFLECERRAMSAVPALPNFADPAAAARAWADEVEAKQVAVAEVAQLKNEVSELAPAAAALARIASDDENFCLTDAAKHLQTGPRKLTKMLLDKGWIYPREAKKGYVAAQSKLDCNYLTHRYGNYQDPDTGQWKKSAQVLVTSKGIAKLAKMLSIQLPQQQGSLQI